MSVSGHERSQPASPTLPWTTADLGGLVGRVAAAFGALIIAWWGTAEHARVSSQLGWLIAGVAAVGVATLRCATFLAAGYHRNAVRRAELTAALAQQGPSALPRESKVLASDQLVALPGLAYFHRSGCTFVQGKDVTSLERSELASEGRRPCPACKP